MQAVLLGTMLAVLSVMPIPVPDASAADPMEGRETVVGGAAAESEWMTASGTVNTIAAHSMTITGAGGGGATFTQTFTIDDRTKVFAKGAGTAAAANGGRVAFSAIVSSGDMVTVSYRKVGGALHANDVRVTRKAMH